MILKRVLLVIMIKIFKDVDDTIGQLNFLSVKMPIVILKIGSEEQMQTIFIKQPARMLSTFAGSAQSAHSRVYEDCAAQSSSICGLRRSSYCAQHVYERQTLRPTFV